MRSLHKRLRSFAILAALATGLASGQAWASSLTIYGNWPTDQLQKVADGFKAKHPDIDVKIFRAPVEELFTMLSMEFMAGAPKADIVFIGDPGRAEQLKAEGHLLKYQPPADVVAGFDPKFVDPDGYWLPVSIVPMVIQYNTKFISKEDAPKSWADLLDPKYKGKIVYADPKMTGSVHTPLYYLTTVLADKGAPYGWSYFEELAKLQPMIVGGHRQMRELVIAGERWIAGEQSIDHVFQPIENKEPVWFVWPEEGTPAYYEVVAGLAKSKNIPEAKKFLDWIASREANEDVLFKGLGRLSVRQDVSFVSPDGKTLKDINLVPIGPELTPEVRAQQAEKFTKIIGQFK